MLAAETRSVSPAQWNGPAPTGGVGVPASRLDELLQRIKAALSPLEQGLLLRELDGVSGGRGESSALLQAPGQTALAAKGRAAPRFDAGDLYGASGKPQLGDVRQTNFGDCYYVATLGAVAMQQPGIITRAIRYDAKTQSFNVTLHDANGRARTINVTQREVASNIAQGGGSRRDDGVKNAPIWPDLMEVAYAKMLDTNHRNGLSEGYTDLGNGGWPKDGMEAVTGREGREVKFDQSFLESRSNALNEVGTQVAAALKSGRPVTAWSVGETDNRSWLGKWRGDAVEQDGLVDNHVYTVTGAYKDASGNWQVQMRNPWGSNAMVGEGRDTNSAFITVPLDTLVRTGGLESFQVG